MRPLLKGALAHTGRLVGIALAVALAVTLVSGTFILTDTIDSAFRASTTAPTGSDLVVRSTARFSAQATSAPEREPLPESLLATVAKVRGVRAVWGAVSGYAQLVDKQGRAIDPKGLPTIGGAWEPGDTLEAGRAPNGPGEVAIDVSTARRYGLHLGDNIEVVFEADAKHFTIGGLLRHASGVVAATRATFDTRTAQQVLGAVGQVDAIPVSAERGTAPATLRARINAMLPDRYEAVTTTQVAQEAEQSWAKAVAFLPTALLLLAAVALLVGALLIFNTFSILVTQRTRELGLLRAVGASRLQLTASVLAEALAVGLVASAAGVVLGLGAARVLLGLLKGIGYELPAASVDFRARTAVLGSLTGMAVTVAAAFLPVRRATRLSPLGAIGGMDADPSSGTGRRIAVGVAATAVGLASLLAGLLGGARRPVPVVAIGAAGVLVGLAALIPLVARPAARALGAPLVRLFGQPSFLGRENAMRSPGRTAATAAALMIGIGLVGVVAIVAASMTASASATVRRTLRADLVVAPVGTPGSSGGVPAVVADRLRRTPAVAAVSEIRAGQWGLDRVPQTLLAVDPRTVTRMHDVDANSRAAVAHLDDKGVLVRDTVAEHHGWRTGDSVPMTFARTGTRPMRIRGLFSTTAMRADYVISLGAFKANYAQQLDTQIDVELAPGVSVPAGRAAVTAAISAYPVAQVLDRSQVLAAQEKRVARLLVPVKALLALSVLIALLGIANTLGLSISERTRELGLLRAIGMGRRQVRAMVRSEAVIIAAMGALLGLGVALFFGWALVGAMRHLGVDALVLPVGELAGLVAAATVAGLVAGVPPARRACRLRVVEAVSGQR